MSDRFLVVSFIFILGLLTFKFHQSTDTTVPKQKVERTEAKQFQKIQERSKIIPKKMELVDNQYFTRLPSSPSIDHAGIQDKEDSDYIKVPQPLSDERLYVAREKISPKENTNIINVPHPETGIMMEMTLDTTDSQDNDYIKVPQPLSDEPLYVARETVLPKKNTKIIHVPHPETGMVLEMTLNTNDSRNNDYIKIQQPLSDEPLYVARDKVTK